MIKSISAALLGLGLAFSASAQAPAANATLASVKGKVMVNTGKSFVMASPGMQLKPGDRIMIEDGSTATVVFNDDCRVDLQSNTLVTVPDTSTCAGAALVQQGLTPGGGSAAGGAGATGTSNTGMYIVAGVVTAIDIYKLNEDDQDTVSP